MARPRKKIYKETSNKQATELFDLPEDILNNIITFLDYEDILELFKTAKKSQTALSKMFLEKHNLGLTLLRNTINHYFGCNINFADFYTDKDHIVLLKTDLLELCKAVFILSKRISRHYPTAFSIIEKYSSIKCPIASDKGDTELSVKIEASLNDEFPEDFEFPNFDFLAPETPREFKSPPQEKFIICFEAKFLLTQWIRLNFKKTESQIGANVKHGFTYALRFYEKNPNLFNGLSLAHFYYLLHSENKRVPLAISPDMIELGLPIRLHNAIKDLVMNKPQAANANVQHPMPALPTVHSGLASLVNNLNFQGKNSLTSSDMNNFILEEVLLSDHFKSNISSLVTDCLISIDPSLSVNLSGIFEKIRWQYILALCTPGANLLLEQTKKYNLLGQLFSLSPLEIQGLAASEVYWLFDNYGKDILGEIKALSKAQTKTNENIKLDLQFIDKTIKLYVKNEDRPISLVELWQSKPILANPKFKETPQFGKLLKSKSAHKTRRIYNLTRKLNAIVQDESMNKAYEILCKVLDPSLALNLASEKVDEAEAQAYVDCMKKYPIFLRVGVSKAWIVSLTEASPAMLDRIAKFFDNDKYKTINFTGSILYFIFDLHKHAEEVNDHSLIDAVLNKFPSLNCINNIYKNNTLTYLLTSKCEGPWLKMLSYEQITFLHHQTLDHIASYEHDTQKIILSHLLLSYNGQDGKVFQTTTSVVRGFATIAEAFLKKQKSEASTNGEVQTPVDFPISETSNMIITSLLKQNENLQNEVEKKDKLITKLRKKITKLENKENSSQPEIISSSQKVQSIEEARAPLLSERIQASVEYSPKFFTENVKPKGKRKREEVFSEDSNIESEKDTASDPDSGYGH